MLYPFRLGWNGDTVEVVSVPGNIVGALVVHNITRLRGEEAEQGHNIYWVSRASPPSLTTGTIFLYIYVCVSSVPPCRQIPYHF